MSLKSQVEVQCPAGCEPFEAEVWSVLRVDNEPELKEKLMAGELNLIMCPSCNRYFIHEVPVVYHDPGRELLAFIFPEFYKEEEERWRSKMAADYAELKRVQGQGRGLEYEPLIYFGLEAFRRFLDDETNLDDEVDIAKHLAKSLKLGLYPVKPSFARAQKLPPFVPIENGPEGDTKEKMLLGLQRLLKENEFLASYQRAFTLLRTAKDRDVPPRA